MSCFDIELFGKRLAACRDALNMKQSEFSSMLGCTNGAYSLYERGKRQPSLEILSILCNRFGISLDYLLSCASPLPHVFCMQLKAAIDAREGKPFEDVLALNGFDRIAAPLFLSGTCFPNAKLFMHICAYYNCSSDFLIGRTDIIDTTKPIPVSIPSTVIQRDPFGDLTPEQRITIEASLKAYRELNAASKEA